MAFDDVLLRRYLTPITPALRQAGVTDLVVNQPGAFLVERHHVWSHHAAPELTPTWLETLARAAAAASAQDVDDAHPICSTHLPDGERCQIVLPPTAAHVSLTKWTLFRDNRRTDGWMLTPAYWGLSKHTQLTIIYSSGARHAPPVRIAAPTTEISAGQGTQSKSVV